MLKFLICFSVLLFAPQIFSTTFKVVPTSEQIKEADGIIIGHYLRSKSIKLEDGTIATQMHFKMEKEYGLRSDFFGMDEVIVHYPGGTIDGTTTSVDGVPEFVEGEKVALYTKSSDNRYWGLNLGYGTYKVINYGNEVMLVNTIFPENPTIGQVKLTEFERMVKNIKGINLKVVQSTQFIEDPESVRNRQPSSLPEGKNRSIASKGEESENTSETQEIPYAWLLGLLAFCGGVFRMSRQKKA